MSKSKNKQRSVGGSDEQKTKSHRRNCWSESNGRRRIEKKREAFRAPKTSKAGEVRGEEGKDNRRHRGFVSEVKIRRTSSSDSLPPSLRHHTLQTAEEQEEGRSLSLPAFLLSLHPSFSSRPTHVTAEHLSPVLEAEAEKREARDVDGEGWWDGEIEGWMDGSRSAAWRRRRGFLAPG
ncbi:hypothetical protein ATANTOWER_002269 [Ataeniobius toweri]|uniref:Uncharacterized protein n=2 Tax=Goodeidae TaxID=28758 RepID=A0ABU7B6U0_9TELE|nr:hypothetical protein [Ataeniobius toweri]